MVLLVVGAFRKARSGLFEAVAFAPELDEDTAMQEAIENGGGERGIAEEGFPVVQEAAERLHASLATLRALLEAIPYPIYLKDLGHRCVECNDEFCWMLGLRREEIIGHTPHDIAASEMADRYFNADREVFASESGQQIYESSMVDAEGVERTAMFHKRVYHNQKGEPEGLVGIVIDVTEFRATEAELRRHRDDLQGLIGERTADLNHAKEMAEQANLAKSEFLANITHELRTPLHAIMSFAKLAQMRIRTGAYDQVAVFPGDIHTAGQRQLVMVNDLLDLAKIEAGKLTVSPVERDVLPLLEESAHILVALMVTKRQQMEWKLETAETSACVDGARIQQVFANLLSNANKFSPVGSTLTLRIYEDILPVGRRATDSQQPALRIERSDQGVGIPENELEAIFQKFVQSGRTKDGSGGTGLGLALCREIVKAHWGRIEARNNPDGGATFSVLLPRKAKGS